MRHISRREFLRLGLAGAALPLFDRVHFLASADRVYLSVPHYSQRHSLSCEMASLRMAAAYHGNYWTEEALLAQLPTNKAQPQVAGGRVLWFDPNLVFPGNVNGFQLWYGGLGAYPDRVGKGAWGYGVYATPIAQVATQIGLWALAFDEVSHVYEALNRRNVPVVIVPWGGRTESTLWKWTTPRGDQVRVMNAQHALAVVGYNADTVWVHDPERKVSTYTRAAFEKAFGLLNCGVEVGPALHRKYLPI